LNYARMMSKSYHIFIMFLHEESRG
jgi:hypothetical protein